jgi:hypothetical protein
MGEAKSTPIRLRHLPGTVTLDCADVGEKRPSSAFGTFSP